MDRRNFLKGAAVGAAGLVLSSSGLGSQNAARPKARAVIWLWMGGGMSQIDTFDPKPGTKNGGEFKAIETSVSGVQFSELLPRCAQQMTRLAVIRSMKTMEGSHAKGTYLMHVGFPDASGTDYPSIGTVVAHELGPKGLDLPRFMAIDPPLLPSSAVFGDDCMPFRLQNADDPIPNLQSDVDAARDRDRDALLQEQNREYDKEHADDESAKLRVAGIRASNLMTSPLLKAFDYKSEPAALRKDYGGRFGINCLLARRLIEAGCPFVEVGMGGWDIHNDCFNNYRRMVPTLDAGLGTLIRDLAEKRLLQETLVVCATEFGRSAELNAGKCRDNSASGFSVLLAGAGIRGGRVYGNTGPLGQDCSDPVSPSRLFATIYAAIGIDPTKRFRLSDDASRDTYVQPAADPLRPLLA